MTITMLTVLSALLIVSGLIYFLMQLINAWCEPEHHRAEEHISGNAEEYRMFSSTDQQA